MRYASERRGELPPDYNDDMARSQGYQDRAEANRDAVTWYLTGWQVTRL